MTSQSVVALSSTSTAPEVGVNRRLTSRSVVVLPQPDSPSSTSVSPRATSRLRRSMMDGPPLIAKLTSRNETSGWVFASEEKDILANRLCAFEKLIVMFEGPHLIHTWLQPGAGTLRMRRETV